MHQRLIIFTLLLITGLIFGCSGGNSPIQPAEIQQPGPDLADFSWDPNQITDNTVVLGMFDLYVDVDKGTVEIVPLRNAEKHFNVWSLLTAPHCYDCLLAKDLTYDEGAQIVEFDLGWHNPYSVSPYDLRTVATSFSPKKIVNADGYTTLFALVPGDINPFIASKTGTGQRQFPSNASLYDHFVIYNPTWPSWIPLTLVVECSYPENCREPYEVSYGGISGNLYNDGSNAPMLQLYARDWQNDVLSVSVDLSPVGGSVITLSQNGAQPEIWEGPVSCAPGTLNGNYDIHVWATTAEPFDQTSDMHNYISLNVVSHAVEGPEVFGPPQKISNSGGASFIWPRHAIAVTSDSASHVVWVDDLTSSGIYHVMYSTNSGGTWSVPAQIDSTDGRAIYATIAADPDDTLHVVWEDQRDYVLGSDIYYASSQNYFSTETVLYSGANGLRNVHPKIEAGDDGALHIVWHTMELVDIDQYEYDVWYLRKLPLSSTWDSPVSIAAAVGVSESFPAVAPGLSNSAYIAFVSDSSGANEIYFTNDIGGSFTTPAAVILGEANQPTLDVSPTGDILLAYFDSFDGTYSDIYFRISTDQGSSWGAAQLVSTSQDAYQVAPDVAATPDGDYHFAWHEEDENGYPGRVLYREYLASTGWQDIIEIVPAGGIGAFPSMAGDSDGHIHLVCELYTPAPPPDDNNYEIWYRDSVQ